MKRNILVVAALLAGCGGEPVIDASSEEALEASMGRITEGLSPERRREFEEALQIVFFNSPSLLAVAMAPTGTQQDARTVLNDKLSGMGVESVIAEAAQITSAAQDRRHRQVVEQLEAVKSELAALQVERDRAAGFALELAKFAAADTSLRFRDDAFQLTPVIKMTVTNATDHAISSAAFNVVVSSPGRTVPWTTERFSHSIPGGVEPGEQQDWMLALSSYGGSWQSVPRDRDDIELTLTTIRLQDAAGDDLYPLPDAEQLSRTESRLLDRIADLEAQLQ